MFFEDAEILHIPPHIAFDCTGCGNCCLQWPVPSTAADRERIIELRRELSTDEKPLSSDSSGWNLPQGQLFRRVDMDVLRNKTNQFQYTMEKQADGRCVFLTDQTRCALHERFGAEAKPSMCQLFPYTFTAAPDGFYASISFASSGALFNQGRALQEQREFLAGRLSLFKKLFPDLKLDWSQIQLVDGLPIRWSQYLLLERTMLGRLSVTIGDTGAGNCTDTRENHVRLSDRLLSISEYLRAGVPSDIDLERLSVVPSSERVDLLLIRHLFQLYFPEDITSSDEEPSVRDLLREMLEDPQAVFVTFGNEQFDLAAVCARRSFEFSFDCENLLARYLYARIFSKLYFGAGMAHFSLISGFHHLSLLIVLIKIRLKCEPAGAGPDLLKVAELVRSLERRLASYQHTSEAATVLQVLLESPTRFERLIALAD